MKKLLFSILFLPIGLFAQTTSQSITPVSGSKTQPGPIKTLEASKHIGKKVFIKGDVSGGQFIETDSSKITILYLDGNFPNHTMSVAIPLDLRGKFPKAPDKALKGKFIRVYGDVTEYQGKPQIVIKSRTDIYVVGDK